MQITHSTEKNLEGSANISTIPYMLGYNSHYPNKESKLAVIFSNCL